MKKITVMIIFFSESWSNTNFFRNLESKKIVKKEIYPYDY